MSILTRFKDIMESNINALLDKAEDPSKMIDQVMRNLEKDLGNVKAETAAIMAEEQRTRRDVEALEAEANKYKDYAQKAVDAGNDDDAKRFLALKNETNKRIESAKAVHESAKAKAEQMRQMHDKLVKDISNLNSRRQEIKAKIAVAKTQEKINNIGSSLSGASTSIGAFDRIEERANNMIDRANAMAELSTSRIDDTAELIAKYDSEASSDADDIEAELAAMKAGK
jgi:phage shock protein A